MRVLRNVIIPKGIEKIGYMWFAGSYVENVVIPRSVKEIRTSAFHGCRHLKSVTFQVDSQLEKIGGTCFCESGLRSF